MKIVLRNKILIFALFACISVLLSFSLVAFKDVSAVWGVLIFMSVVIGLIVYLFDLYNALRLEIYFLSMSFLIVCGYLLFLLFYESLDLNAYFSAVISVSISFLCIFVSLKTKLQERLTTSIYKLLEKDRAKISTDLRTYRKYAIQEWFLSYPNCISNQPALMFAIRVFFFVLISSGAIYGLSNRIPLFLSPDLLFAQIAYIYLLGYSIVYFIAGFRFSSKPAFLSWVIILVAYSLFRLVSRYVLLWENYRSLIYAAFYTIALITIIVVWNWVRKEIHYTNVQMFERDDQYLTVDLYLSDFAPISGLDTIFSFSIVDQEIKTKTFVYLLKHLMHQANKSDSLFIGYISYPDQELVTFYFYTASVYESKLESRIKNQMSHLGYLSEQYESSYDPNWEFYAGTLHPDQKEFCSIISRNYMEDLFLQGVSFDKEYELSFTVYFKNKNDFIEFEERMSYFGFSLSHASFDEKEEMQPGYFYCGAYKIKSFLTPRRIEYINDLFLDQTERFGSALYLGEWRISHQSA